MAAKSQSTLILKHRTGDHDSLVELRLAWETKEGGIWDIRRFSGRLRFWVFSDHPQGTFKKIREGGKVAIHLNQVFKTGTIPEPGKGKGVTATYYEGSEKVTRVVVRDGPESHLLQKKGKARLYKPAIASAKDELVDWEARSI